MVFTCGDLTIRDTQQKQHVEGETISGESSLGEQKTYEIKGKDGLRILIAYSIWQNDERDVHAIQVDGSDSKPLRQLERHRHRLGVNSFSQDNSFAELSQARVKPDKWSGLYKATIAELDAGAGIDCSKTLKDAGAIQIDTREAILNDDSSRKNFLCAVFRKDNEMLPVVAFVLTRVLPLRNEYLA